MRRIGRLLFRDWSPCETVNVLRVRLHSMPRDDSLPSVVQRVVREQLPIPIPEKILGRKSIFRLFPHETRGYFAGLYIMRRLQVSLSSPHQLFSRQHDCNISGIKLITSTSAVVVFGKEEQTYPHV